MNYHCVSIYLKFRTKPIDERITSLSALYSSDTKLGVMKMPPAIEYSVRKQNIKFMHNRNQFSAEYFQFIKKLVSCNPHNINRQNLNEKLVSSLHLYFQRNRA